MYTTYDVDMALKSSLGISEFDDEQRQLLSKRIMEYIETVAEHLHSHPLDN